MSDIYKVLTEEEWQEANSSGEIITSLDQKDGLFTFPAQSNLR